MRDSELCKRDASKFPKIIISKCQNMSPAESASSNFGRYDRPHYDEARCNEDSMGFVECGLTRDHGPHRSRNKCFIIIIIIIAGTTCPVRITVLHIYFQ